MLEFTLYPVIMEIMLRYLQGWFSLLKWLTSEDGETERNLKLFAPFKKSVFYYLSFWFKQLLWLKWLYFAQMERFLEL